jgi:hypothetical protein
MKLAGTVVALTGLVVLAAGLFLGFGTISRGGVTCGSAFRGSDSAATQQEFTTALEGGGVTDLTSGCQSARGDRKTFALATVVPGAVLLVAGGVLVAFAMPPVPQRTAS